MGEAVASAESLVLAADNFGCLRPRHVGTEDVIRCSFCDDCKRSEQTTNTTLHCDTTEGNKAAGAGGGCVVGK